MNDKLAGQGGVDELHLEVLDRAARQAKQAVGDEIGMLGSQHGGKYLLAEAECHCAEHQREQGDDHHTAAKARERAEQTGAVGTEKEDEGKGKYRHER